MLPQARRIQTSWVCPASCGEQSPWRSMMGPGILGEMPTMPSSACVVPYAPIPLAEFRQLCSSAAHYQRWLPCFRCYPPQEQGVCRTVH
jgi:hypothetical protein